MSGNELRRIQSVLNFIIAASDKQDVGLVLEWWTVVKNKQDIQRNEGGGVVATHIQKGI